MGNGTANSSVVPTGKWGHPRQLVITSLAKVDVHLHPASHSSLCTFPWWLGAPLTGFGSTLCPVGHLPWACIVSVWKPRWDWGGPSSFFPAHFLQCPLRHLGENLVFLRLSAWSVLPCLPPHLDLYALEMCERALAFHFSVISLFMYLFSAVPVLVAVWAFSRCGERGLLSALSLALHGLWLQYLLLQGSLGSRALGFGGCRTWARLSCVWALQQDAGA